MVVILKQVYERRWNKNVVKTLNLDITIEVKC